VLSCRGWGSEAKSTRCKTGGKSHKNKDPNCFAFVIVAFCQTAQFIFEMMKRSRLRCNFNAEVEGEVKRNRNLWLLWVDKFVFISVLPSTDGSIKTIWMSLQGRRERRKGKKERRCMPDDEEDCNLR
jgi:hypothetical protein